jgi:SAM-dependent methyltransferase
MERRRPLDELRPYVEKARRLRGWKFDVQMTALGPKLPWDYVERARELLENSDSVLDMGTGGGERFATIAEGWKGLAVATESWPPNVRVAATRLVPMNVAVAHTSSLHLPFADGSFDLVLNRHEELEPAEVARTLARGGRVLTQQVGRSNWCELRGFFPRMSDFGPLLELYQRGFSTAGLTVERAETHENSVAYRSLGDVAYLSPRLRGRCLHSTSTAISTPSSRWNGASAPRRGSCSLRAAL